MREGPDASKLVLLLCLISKKTTLRDSGVGLEWGRKRLDNLERDPLSIRGEKNEITPFSDTEYMA